MKLHNRFAVTLGREGIPLDQLILAYAHLLEDRDATFLPLANENSFWEAFFLTVGITPTDELHQELADLIVENFDEVSVPSGDGMSALGISLKEGKREGVLTYRGRYRHDTDTVAARISINLDANGLLRRDANVHTKTAPRRVAWSCPAAPSKSRTCLVRRP